MAYVTTETQTRGFGALFAWIGMFLKALSFSHDAAYRIQNMMTLSDQELADNYGIERHQIYDFVTAQRK